MPKMRTTRLDGPGGARVELRGGFALPMPARRAFGLFTARGEELWVPGWVPRFPVEGADDLEPGTVWTTLDDDGRLTTWVVLAAEPPRSVRYARVAERWTAGTVAVELSDEADGCRVEVAYDLTALTDEAAAALPGFAEGYPDYVASWRAAILAHVESGGAMPDPA
ncbi:SRPBCC domain-containing protein [Agromyces sp. SYSU T0242]|uniref:SRPBCC domain-containing protein n=1 Tax=Agromyces litoreus TaxID=3158561 RepID=UPI0033999F8A